MARALALCLAFFALLSFGAGQTVFGLILAAVAAFLWLRHSVSFQLRLKEWAASRPRGEPVKPPATIAQLRERALDAGGGAYLAIGERGEWIAAPPEAAVLALAGPRAGKTTCVVIPGLAAHPGAAVSTSTKPEVLKATLSCRLGMGQAWFFDLSGRGAPAGTRPLRWSPVSRADDWQRAQLIAEGMAGAADTDRDGAHWRERAGALIAACLYAAARSGQGMREVAGWVLRHDPEAPLAELPADSLARDVLSGIARTADRERASIFSTAARVLRAYRSEVALAASQEPNFDPEAFVSSTDTIYIAAAAHQQALLAPLVVGLLVELRELAYDRHAQIGNGSPPLVFMLDECANIAPLPDLPAMLSEAGGQGVQVVAVLQDLSQARRRWPADAKGLMSLFGARVFMAGIADPETLEQISLLCGEWDRPVETITQGRRHSMLDDGLSQSWSTRTERRLSPAEIAQLPHGQALVMIGPDWQILPTLPYNQHPAFAHLIAPGHATLAA